MSFQDVSLEHGTKSPLVEGLGNAYNVTFFAISVGFFSNPLSVALLVKKGT